MDAKIIPTPIGLNRREIPQHIINEINRDYTLADYQYEKIIEEIKRFESRLDGEHEVAIALASFGTSITIAVTQIGFYNPSLIVFHGFVNGNQSTLVQHISQLNFLLTSVPKADPEKPARRIGFDISDSK